VALGGRLMYGRGAGKVGTMSESTELASPQRVSRRTVVKSGLVVGGALWAAPVVSVLTATKASASTPSSPNPSPSPTAAGISYVILVLEYNGVVVTAKLNDDGTVSCPGHESSDTGGRFGEYLTANSWTPSSSTTCPAGLAIVSASTTQLSASLPSGYSLVGFMVHDGTLPHDTGKVGFASGTNLPANSIYLPLSWGAPTITASGPVGPTTVVFQEP
jgi:hypothetical protein